MRVGTSRPMIGRRGIAPARMLGLHVRAAKARRVAAQAAYGDPGKMRARRRFAVSRATRPRQASRLGSRGRPERCTLEREFDGPLGAIRQPQATPDGRSRPGTTAPSHVSSPTSRTSPPDTDAHFSRRPRWRRALGPGGLDPHRLPRHLRVVRRVGHVAQAVVALVALEPLEQRGRGRAPRRRSRRAGRRSSANRAGTVRTVSSRGSASGSSSHSSGVETGACGSGRTEYADAMVRSRAFWL